MKKQNLYKTSYFIIIFFILSTNLGAQIKNINHNIPANLLAPSHNLFALNKTKISHSLTFSSYFHSNTKEALLSSNFCTHFDYKITKSLDLKLDINFVNLGTFGLQKYYLDNSQSKILPNFQLRYTPNPNFSLEIKFNRYQNSRNFFP